MYILPNMIFEILTALKRCDTVWFGREVPTVQRNLQLSYTGWKRTGEYKMSIPEDGGSMFL